MSVIRDEIILGGPDVLSGFGTDGLLTGGRTSGSLSLEAIASLSINSDVIEYFDWVSSPFSSLMFKEGKVRFGGSRYRKRILWSFKGTAANPGAEERHWIVQSYWRKEKAYWSLILFYIISEWMPALRCYVEISRGSRNVKLRGQDPSIVLSDTEWMVKVQESTSEAFAKRFTCKGTLNWREFNAKGWDLDGQYK
jgi:hypothetical protein